MDTLVDDYVEANFSDELAAEIRRSLSLCDFFDVEDVNMALNDVLVLEGNEQPVGIYDGFMGVLKSKLEEILKAHTLVLSDEASLEQTNEILTALARVQYREDYSNIIRILEGFASDEEQLTEILAEMCELDQIALMSLIISFDPSIMDVLKKFIYAREAEVEVMEEVVVPLRDNLKLFFKADDECKSIGRQLNDAGMMIGATFAAYLPYISDVLRDEKEIPMLALHILSILYMSSDAYTTPLETYRAHSIELLGDIKRTAAVEVKLIEMINVFNEFAKAENEKARLSETGSAA